MKEVTGTVALLCLLIFVILGLVAIRNSLAAQSILCLLALLYLAGILARLERAQSLAGRVVLSFGWSAVAIAAAFAITIGIVIAYSKDFL